MADKPKLQLELEEPQIFTEKIVAINRCTKVTKGGRKLHFSALVVVGDGKGKVGMSLGKANEVADAIRKAIKQAKKSLVDVPLVDGRTIPHQIAVKFGAVEILLKPASAGTGIIASGPVRAVCECAGIKDILTKIVRKSSNPINVIYATLEAFKSLKRPHTKDIQESDDSKDR